MLTFILADEVINILSNSIYPGVVLNNVFFSRILSHIIKCYIVFAGLQEVSTGSAVVFLRLYI